jgi:hypothetical protein
MLIYLCYDKVEDSIPAETQQSTDDREQHCETDEDKVSVHDVSYGFLLSFPPASLAMQHTSGQSGSDVLIGLWG